MTQQPPLLIFFLLLGNVPWVDWSVSSEVASDPCWCLFLFLSHYSPSTKVSLFFFPILCIPLSDLWYFSLAVRITCRYDTKTVSQTPLLTPDTLVFFVLHIIICRCCRSIKKALNTLLHKTTLYSSMEH